MNKQEERLRTTREKEWKRREEQKREKSDLT
jgi:hypothetical protein